MRCDMFEMFVINGVERVEWEACLNDMCVCLCGKNEIEHGPNIIEMRCLSAVCIGELKKKHNIFCDIVKNAFFSIFHSSNEMPSIWI